MDAPKFKQSFSKWIDNKELVTHAVIDKAYPASNPLNAVMKTIVPVKGKMRIGDVVKAICTAGPCEKCEAMVLVTGRVCFGTCGGALIDIPPVFDKSHYHEGEVSNIYTSFCNDNENHPPLKQKSTAGYTVSNLF